MNPDVDDPAEAYAEHQLEEVIRSFERENARLREAISDALADLTPGISPHGLLDAALRAKDGDDRLSRHRPHQGAAEGSGA
jgi:hypothetical protein